MQERYTRDYERMCEIGARNFGGNTADGRLAKAAGVVAAGAHRPGWKHFGGG